MKETLLFLKATRNKNEVNIDVEINTRKKELIAIISNMLGELLKRGSINQLDIIAITTLATIDAEKGEKTNEFN